MSEQIGSKFKIPTSEDQANDCDSVPFFPKYVSERVFHKHMRLTWFEVNFSQSRYNRDSKPNGSNACTLIAVLTAARCFYGKIIMGGPEKPLNTKIVYALAFSMLIGNTLHENLKTKGVLNNINLTVPEALQHAGDMAEGMKEWKSILCLQPLALTLFDNLKSLWIEWRYHCDRRKKYKDLYVVLISDFRSVLFIVQSHLDTVTLMDSHQHTVDKGAFIATVNRSKLKILCHWYSDLIYQCYKSYPRVYELSLLYFRDKKKP